MHIFPLQALELSKYRLLETASPDSLIRLRGLKSSQEVDDCIKIYFKEQQHSSLLDILKAKLFDSQSPSEGFLLHITTHSHLLSLDDVKYLYCSLTWESVQVAFFSLQEFDTEMDFSNKIR